MSLSHVTAAMLGPTAGSRCNSSFMAVTALVFSPRTPRVSPLRGYFILDGNRIVGPATLNSPRPR